MTVTSLKPDASSSPTSIGSSYSDPAVQESLFQAAEQHVAAHQARIFDLLAIQLHNLNTAQDALSRKDAIENLQQIHQLLSQDPHASTYVKTQALWQVCQQRISTMQSIQPTSASVQPPPLVSRVSNYAHRSFEWLKTHPLIPVAIAGVLAAGYMTYAYLNRTPPQVMDESALDAALTPSCREALSGSNGFEASDFKMIQGRYQSPTIIGCTTQLSAQGLAKASQMQTCGLYTYVPYPRSKIAEIVRSRLAPCVGGLCEDVLLKVKLF
jgi:hypothetical protein